MDKDSHKLELLRKALQLIWEKAKEDGQITEDEKAIIDTVTSSLESYEELYENAIEDGVITQEERNQLLDLEEEIYSEAYFTAMQDDVLTDEEAILFKILMKTVNPKADVDWVDREVRSSNIQKEV